MCSISDDGVELRVTDADVDDTAVYSCIARNVAGEMERNFNIDVHSTSFHIISRISNRPQGRRLTFTVRYSNVKQG